MARKVIPIDVERKLYAESMGRCMNPGCQAELFRKKGNVIEAKSIPSIEESCHNHILVFAAEKSRLSNQVIDVKEYIASI